MLILYMLVCQPEGCPNGEIESLLPRFELEGPRDTIDPAEDGDSWTASASFVNYVRAAQLALLSGLDLAQLELVRRVLQAETEAKGSSALREIEPSRV